MHEAQLKCARKLSALLFAVALVAGASGHILLALDVDAAPHCTDIVPISPNDRYPGRQGEVGETFCYRLDLDTPGVLIVSAAVPASAAVEPKLRFTDPDGDGARARVAGWSPAGLILRTHEPGAVVFELASQDPRRALGQHVVTSRFAAASVVPPRSPQGDDTDTIATKDTEDPEIVPIQGSPTLPESYSGKTLRAKDPQPFDPAAGPALRFPDLCRPDPTDDHDDLFACASPLRAGERVLGEIAGSWTDDHDVFTFVLDEPRTVRLETQGDIDTAGVLYDPRGHRLDSADDGGDGGNFSLVRTLAPGRYFVRVEGHFGAHGTYSLTFETLSW